MKRFFHQPTDYKKSTPHISDPDFVPLAKINDQKAQKNGTKKTVYWVKNKPRDEDGTVKGEKWKTSQQYVGDWKDNKKHGYGILIYDNRDKYEGYWKNDNRHGKGTYWVCIGKNKYRKLYTGDWYENKKEGSGIYFYKDGSCYDGTWKNSKRDGKGLMIYADGDIYEGAWQNDLKHGYGILEKKTGDKYYGYWINGLKEGQGYFYYNSSSKIYLGEWHDDVPMCGIFTDVDEDPNIKKKMRINSEDDQPMIPVLKLKSPDQILEDSINNIFFLRNIKMTRNKTFRELFPIESHIDLIKIFKINSPKNLQHEEEKENEHKIPDNFLSSKEFRKIAAEYFSIVFDDQTLELIFYIFGIPYNEEELKIDFLMFTRLLYLGYCKLNGNVAENTEDLVTNSNKEIINKEGKYNFTSERLKDLHESDRENLEHSEEEDEGVNFNTDEFDEEY